MSQPSRRESLTNSFYQLTADRILNSVEAGIQKIKRGVRATGSILALNSLENRVHEIELDDGSRVVSKFYRPGRWSAEQIAEEHAFLKKLEGAEIPVVVPMEQEDSKLSKISAAPTLAISPEGIYFAVFPKVRGRLVDELSKTKLETLGRYLGRIHNIGSHWTPKHRLRLNVENFGWEPLDFLLDSDFLDDHTHPHYEKVAEEFLKLAESKLSNVPSVTVHGDCHLGNTLWLEDAPFFLDFDDMTVAPAVQDIWMIIRERGEEAADARATLLRSYEQMFEFDHSTLSLIEALRGLRIIHYSAWIARRWEDPSFPHAFPHFGSPSYWREEIQALHECLDLLRLSNVG